jgi:hypothetical protein
MVGLIIMAFAYAGILAVIRRIDKRHEEKHPHKWNAWDQDNFDRIKRQQDWEDMNNSRKRYY